MWESAPVFLHRTLGGVLRSQRPCASVSSVATPHGGPHLSRGAEVDDDPGRTRRNDCFGGRWDNRFLGRRSFGAGGGMGDVPAHRWGCSGSRAVRRSRAQAVFNSWLEGDRAADCGAGSAGQRAANRKRVKGTGASLGSEATRVGRYSCYCGCFRSGFRWMSISWSWASLRVPHSSSCGILCAARRRSGDRISVVALVGGRRAGPAASRMRWLWDVRVRQGARPPITCGAPSAPRLAARSPGRCPVFM